MFIISIYLRALFVFTSFDFYRSDCGFCRLNSGVGKPRATSKILLSISTTRRLYVRVGRVDYSHVCGFVCRGVGGGSSDFTTWTRTPSVSTLDRLLRFWKRKYNYFASETVRSASGDPLETGSRNNVVRSDENIVVLSTIVCFYFYIFFFRTYRGKNS